MLIVSQDLKMCWTTFEWSKTTGVLILQIYEGGSSSFQRPNKSNTHIYEAASAILMHHLNNNKTHINTTNLFSSSTADSESSLPKTVQLLLQSGRRSFKVWTFCEITTGGRYQNPVKLVLLYKQRWVRLYVQLPLVLPEYPRLQVLSA